MTRFDTDVLVAGGGPVGLATAIEARLAGLRVMLVEPRHGPIDKACGEGLMPTARAALTRLGVAVEGREFYGIAYRAADHAADARFSGGPGLGVRRTALSHGLTERAADLGVHRVTGRIGRPHLDADGVEVAGLRAGWLLAADGLHSPTRRHLGLDRATRHRPRFGLRRHFALTPWSDLVEVHWAEDTEAYVTPVADDCVGVAVLGPRGQDFATALAAFPELTRRLHGAPPASDVRGAGPLYQAVAGRVRGRVLLVGDAAGYVDALTGEGLSVGFASARAAVAAVCSPDAGRYEREWLRITRRSRWATQALLAVTSWSPARRRLVPLAQRLPALFTGVVDSLA